MGSESLKPTETVEKLVLPGKDEIKTEKTIQGVLDGVKGFESEKLKTVKTREPDSPLAVVQTEKARESSLSALNEFDKTTPKKAETEEKNSLPSTEAIAQEMEHIKFKDGIDKYDKGQLTHTETMEQNTLPTKEVIEMEKSA